MVDNVVTVQVVLSQEEFLTLMLMAGRHGDSGGVYLRRVLICSPAYLAAHQARLDAERALFGRKKS